MADTLNVGTAKAVFVVADEENQKKVLVHGSTVYYGGPNVSSSSNDGSITDGDSETFTDSKYFISAGSSQLVIEEGPSGDEIEAAPEAYEGTDSHQVIAADLNLDAGAGTSASGDSSFLGAIMGNVLGATLTKTKNYLAGLIGHYNVTGTKNTTYPAGAVLGGIGDGVTAADGAFVAYIDGDSATTTAGAAFKVRTNNSTAASGFDYGLDLQDAAHDGFQAVDSAFYNAAVVRLVEDICLVVGTATPTDGVSGTGVGIAGKGSLHLNTSDGKLRTNTNTKTSPTWTVVGSQS
jgi:hypothetical protein